MLLPKIRSVVSARGRSNVASLQTELNVLSGKVHDLDHLNLLARYIGGMCEDEFNQYRAALFVTKATDLKDIINLTQYTQNYSLIAPTDTLESAGRKPICGKWRLTDTY